MKILSKSWKVNERFFNLKNKWVEFIGESCEDKDGNELEYYRVNRSDSLIIIPICGNKIILPQIYYRHGIEKDTLDFPGGRFPNDRKFEDVSHEILFKELGIQKHQVKSLEVLNENGWYVDSSFSNQRLFGVVAHLDDKDVKLFGKTVDCDTENLRQILESLICLQCRAVFIEWLQKNKFLEVNKNY